MSLAGINEPLVLDFGHWKAVTDIVEERDSLKKQLFEYKELSQLKSNLALKLMHERDSALAKVEELEAFLSPQMVEDGRGE